MLKIFKKIYAWFKKSDSKIFYHNSANDLIKNEEIKHKQDFPQNITNLITNDYSEEYGQIRTLVCITENEKITFSVGKKFPLKSEGSEGESLILSEHFLINILWSDLSIQELQFLKGLCQGFAIYQNSIDNYLVVIFFFSGRPIYLPIVHEKEIIESWCKRKYEDGTNAYFFLTEATNQKIRVIRNIRLPNEFLSVLRGLLDNYTTPDLKKIQAVVSKDNLSYMIDEADFFWVYSKKSDLFILK